MRRTLLKQCSDCKYRTILYYCDQGNCKKCKLFTKPTPKGRNEDGEVDEVDQTRQVTCLCICDATDEELRTKTCKYKEVVK